MMKVVLDTNVLISGFFWKGTPYQLIELAEHGLIRLFTSDILLAELHGILSQPKHARTIAVGEFSIDDIMRRYQKVAVVVPTKKFTQQICRDADDDAVLACALAANANMIITGDKDLLVLHPFQDIPILTPAAAAKLLSKIN